MNIGKYVIFLLGGIPELVPSNDTTDDTIRLYNALTGVI